ncbi:helix-turn-helix domain-containing protein [Falsibacillus albus]|uniref:XRE family transcriptional regulator n=1 Tax=Falsibacillus albus TaxID=2478915 RepID=A0A3L7JTQ0_9BACI|nr:helix-turn-helix transcriptional regulator [Falsibacillus albus]RLQ93644.1 XRE family transcriptional regulator [Falsibacillus albus]
MTEREIFGHCLGKHIRLRRIEIGWSQEKLEEMADLSVTMIGKIERGERIPESLTLFKIAEAMGISLDRLQVDVMECMK